MYSNTYKINDNYRIQPGDVLKISVLDEPDLRCNSKVSSNGKIIYPLLGEVKVSDHDTLEITNILTELLKKYIKNPIVTVYIEQYAKVFVYGKVFKPGAYELSEKLTIMQTISLAGGLKDVANPKKIIIKRQKDGKTLTFNVDLTELTQKKSSEIDIYLEPNDVIIVPESFL